MVVAVAGGATVPVAATVVVVADEVADGSAVLVPVEPPEQEATTNSKVISFFTGHIVPLRGDD